MQYQVCNIILAKKIKISKNGVLTEQQNSQALFILQPLSSIQKRNIIKTGRQWIKQLNYFVKGVLVYCLQKLLGTAHCNGKKAIKTLGFQIKKLNIQTKKPRHCGLGAIKPYP